MTDRAGRAAMAAAPGAGGAGPRKFSEKIALHTQRQAEETRAFEQLMTDLTLSRVQFQKLQQLRLAQCHGGSLPNVSQLRGGSSDFQPSAHAADSVRGTRHHGLVERPSRTRVHALHRRPGDKPGRPFEASLLGSSYSAQALDESWPRQQLPGKDDKLPGFRLASALSRTNSDSALHTSALNAKPQDPYGGGAQPAWGTALMDVYDGDGDVHGEAPSLPGLLRDESLLRLPRPAPEQLWETKEAQPPAGRLRPCNAGGGTPFPHNGQSAGLLSVLRALQPGGSLPDLTSLHYAAPLPASLDPGDHLFGGMSVGSSVGNLPAAMTHLDIRSSSGLQSSRSNPSIQATLSQAAFSSPHGHPQTAGLGASVLHASLRHFSMSNPSLSTAGLSGPPRRRQPPVSPLTLSPGLEPPPAFCRQLPTTSPPTPYLASQVMSADQSPAPYVPAEAQPSPPPPYHAAPEPLLPQPCSREPPAPQPPTVSPLPQADIQLLLGPAQGSSMTSFFPDVNFDQQPPQPSPALQVPLTPQGPREAQEQLLRHGLCSGCGTFPNSVLAEDSGASLFRDLSSALAGMPEASLDAGAPFPLEEELQIEPLSLDGLSMLSDASLGLLDAAEDAFRADRL